ncbi:Leucine-rich repeat domain, L domain-like [Phytophthora cactorum]|nr:Leucine-rich repeat domain, L domain-like [Phytophthora cactorum]
MASTVKYGYDKLHFFVRNDSVDPFVLQNVLMEIPEVILQILSLRDYMAQGLDSSLLYCYASLMALNAFIVFYHMQFRWNEAAFHHMVKDSILDAACAVFFPALILFYSFFVFQDDLKAVKIRQHFFPPRVFERKARNYVSAKELNMFSTDFESLLIRSGWDIFLKLTFSLLACLRWTRITNVLLKRERKIPRGLSLKTAGGSLATFTKEKDKSVTPLDAVGVANRLKGEISCRTRAVATAWTSNGSRPDVSGVWNWMHRVHCRRSAECVQYSQQWVLGESTDQCHCLAYVDRELAPADSQELTDVTQTLASLAAAGKLQTVQLVNRKINGSLPNELETCQGLRNLVLIHTGVEVFPSWTSTSFSKLEYLHIEGDSSEINLTELPSDLFNSMTSLHTIHLSYHAFLPSLPSMVGLKSLESVYFGYLDLIKDLPPMVDLQAIQVLALEGLVHVRALPDVEQYRDTLEMVFVQDSPACCSGFLSGGGCNTTFLNCCERRHSSDSSSGDSLPPTCLSMPDEDLFLPTNTTLSILSRFATNISNFCDPAQATCPYSFAVKSIWQTEDVCAGVLYRECSSEYEGVGICFNQDMGRVKCIQSQTIIDMRKAEIEAGCSCDQVEEKWLGCA